MRVVAFLMLAGCGRLGFDARADAADPLAQGLVAHWRLDDGAGGVATEDIAHHDGTITGNFAWTTGQLGGAIELTDGAIAIDWSLAPAVPNAFTIALWARPDAATRAAYDRYAASYWYAGNDSGTIEMDNGDDGQGVRCIVHVGGQWSDVQALTGVAGDRWQHVACSFDGAVIAAWIDGAIDGAAQATGMVAATASYPVMIGASSDGPDTQNNFTGALDDVRIYDRALSPAEMAALAGQ